MKKRIIFLAAVAIVSHFACKFAFENINPSSIQLEQSRGVVLEEIINTK